MIYDYKFQKIIHIDINTKLNSKKYEKFKKHFERKENFEIIKWHKPTWIGKKGKTESNIDIIMIDK